MLLQWTATGCDRRRAVTRSKGASAGKSSAQSLACAVMCNEHSLEGVGETTAGVQVETTAGVQVKEGGGDARGLRGKALYKKGGGWRMREVCARDDSMLSRCMNLGCLQPWAATCVASWLLRAAYPYMVDGAGRSKPRWLSRACKDRWEVAPACLCLL